MTTCLVTGGAGFIGSHLVERLLAGGHRVRVLDALSTGKRENLRAVEDQVTFLEGSVIDPAAVAKAVQGCARVFHLAALPSVTRSVEDPLATHAVCATGTLQVLEAARRAGVQRVVYAASSSAYGDLPGAVRSEDDPARPLSPYAVAKLTGEYYCQCFTRLFGLETIRLRFFNVFGPRQDSHNPYSGVIALFIAAMASGRRPTIHGDGLQSRDFTYVDNAVEALCLAAEVAHAVGQVYNVGNGGSTTLLDLVRLLNALLGTQIQPSHGPARPGDVRHSRANLTRTRSDLGYEPAVSFEDGLARTVTACRFAS
jgi:UDP-glucose 4-epimerase